MSNNDSFANQRPMGWRTVGVLVALWVVGCTVAGIVVASGIGEFGSAVYVGVGFFVGVSGAIAHGLLLQLERFRRVGYLAQTFVLAATAGLPTLLLEFLKVHTLPSISGEMFRLFYGPTLGLALVGGLTINGYLHRERW